MVSLRQGFTFGTEYNKTMINMALRTQEPLAVVPSIDELGHGTMLAELRQAAGGKRIISAGWLRKQNWLW